MTELQYNESLAMILYKKKKWWYFRKYNFDIGWVFDEFISSIKKATHFKIVRSSHFMQIQ